MNYMRTLRLLQTSVCYTLRLQLSKSTVNHALETSTRLYSRQSAKPLFHICRSKLHVPSVRVASRSISYPRWRTSKLSCDLWHTTSSLFIANVASYKGDAKAMMRYTDAQKALSDDNLQVDERVKQHLTAVRTSDSGWMIRLANENSYLSWCRNTYLTTVLGVAMMAEATGPMMQIAGECALGMAALILTVGSTTFIHTIFVLRTRLHMSHFGLLIHISGCLTHMLVWVCIVLVYIGYIDDEEIHASIDDI